MPSREAECDKPAGTGQAVLNPHDGRVEEGQGRHCLLSAATGVEAGELATSSRRPLCTVHPRLEGLGPGKAVTRLSSPNGRGGPDPSPSVALLRSCTTAGNPERTGRPSVPRLWKHPASAPPRGRRPHEAHGRTARADGRAQPAGPPASLARDLALSARLKVQAASGRTRARVASGFPYETDSPQNIYTWVHHVSAGQTSTRHVN